MAGSFRDHYGMSEKERKNYVRGRVQQMTAKANEMKATTAEIAGGMSPPPVTFKNNRGKVAMGVGLGLLAAAALAKK